MGREKSTGFLCSLQWIKPHLKLWISNNVHNHKGSGLDLKLTLDQSAEVKYFLNSETTVYLQQIQRNQAATPEAELYYPTPLLLHCEAADFHFKLYPLSVAKIHFAETLLAVSFKQTGWCGLSKHFCLGVISRPSMARNREQQRGDTYLGTRSFSSSETRRVSQIKAQ